MITRIQKWGHSLALRIPKSFATEVGLEQHALVKISLEDGKLIITPIEEMAYSLESLLSQVTEENIHREVNTGSAVGKEIW
jgi:antitoxin MazE